MSLAATVLTPTHDHGDLLAYSVRSALAQTVQDIEIFIVGDGTSDATRRTALELAQQDRRVRFFDNPKGPRAGEMHRHPALSHARGEIVAYLSDDDLWLPDHIETMRQLLSRADFAHTLPVYVNGRGQLDVRVVDLAVPLFREMHLAGANRIGLSFAAHRLDMYRRLPQGWQTPPDGAYGDAVMWRQFLAHPECRPVSSTRPTAISFPSSFRRNWTPQRRSEELEKWAKNVADPGWRAGFHAEVLDYVARCYARLEAARYGIGAGYLRKRLLYFWYSGVRGRRLRARLLRLPLAGRLIRSVGGALIGPLAR